MKNNLNIILSVMGCFVLLIGCQQDTFTTDPLIEDIEAPSNLSYFEVLNARENAAVKTGVPAINSGGLPPYYEIVSARKADGTILDASYMDDVSIENPIEEEKNLRPEDYYEQDGELITTYIGINTSKSGRISIADENQFGIDDYYFTIKVTTFVNDVPKETVFEDVFHLGVGPGLVTNLLYSPIAQNIVVGSGGTTTQPYLITGNPDVTFALGTENQEENLNIDTETGIISLKDGFTVTEDTYLYPEVLVTSNISQETTMFQGESFLILVASNAPVDLPKLTNYFFYPTLQAENKLYGYEKTVVQAGDVTDYRTWLQAAPAPLAASERPESVIGNKSIWTNMTADDWEPHESFVTINPQDLTQYSLGYNLSMVFYSKNQYVEYMTDGGTPTELEIYISEDYTGEDATSTWTQINDQLSCQINSTTSTPFIGTPYPGDQKLGAGDPDGKKDTSRNADGKWVRNELNLNAYKSSKSFAVKFRIVSLYEGPGKPASGSVGRPGRYYISDVHFKASEE